ncbi:MAG: hypothetical protein U0234_05200 [Sandaracinus sp.]
MDRKLFVFDAANGQLQTVYFVVFIADTPGRGYTTAALVPITDDGAFAAVTKHTGQVEAAAETLLRAAHAGRNGGWAPWKDDPAWNEMYERWAGKS